jgi:alpha-D-xyloside xylohydrolase
MSLPLLVRPNSLVAMGGNSQRPDYEYTEGLTLRLYQLGEGQAVTAVIPAADGSISATFTASREQNIVTVTPQGIVKSWRLLLVGIDTATSVEGGSAKSTPRDCSLPPITRRRP